jgi:site-specific DNA recombinase
VDCISRAALYIRVSTEEQASEGQSVDAQIETLSQYCKLYNIEIFDIYKDLGISGKETKNRPGLKRMLQDARRVKFNMILVWKISRLSRNLKDLLLILDDLEKSNIVFSSYSEKFDTSTAVGKMTLQLLGSIAEFERNTIIDNVKLGLQEYANKGGKTGTVLGYDNQNKQLVINTMEAEIVKLIYRLYTVARMSMSDIAKHLNELGYKTKRNNSFNKDSVAVILSNPVYIGINRHKIGEKDEYQTPGLHQYIIDIDTWNIAQSLRKSNKKSRPTRSKKHSFLLSGKIICPQCSVAMHSFTSTVASKDYHYYRCKSCSTICKAAPMEDAVIDKIRELLYSEKVIKDVILHTSKSSSYSVDIDSEHVEKEMSKTRRLMDKYVYLLERDEFAASEIILSKIKELEIKLKEHQNFREAVSMNKSCQTTSYSNEDYINKTSDVFANQDRIVLKKVIDISVKSITLHTNKTLKDIKLNFSINEL